MELAWNAQKNQMKDVKGKEKEQEREGTIRNEDIDLERTKYNYDLVESDKNLYQRVKERVEDLKAQGSRVQKNSVVMYSNILTVPKEQAEIWGEQKTDDYFKACYDFFCEEFGKENVVSGKVHKDETAPHMHLQFVPVNKENGKLQARVAMNKAKINSIHDELPKFLQERGFDVVRGSGKTKDKNIENIHEYKAVKEKVAETENELANLQNDIKIFKEPKQVLEKIEGAAKKAMFGDKVSLPSRDFDKLKDLAISSIKTKHKLDRVKDGANEKIEELESRVRLADLRADNAEMQFGLLEKEVDKHRENAIIYQSILEDTNRDLKIGDIEKKGRLIMYRLKNGHEPKNQEEGEEWLSILEQNKIANTIPEKRLEIFIQFLKSFLDRLLGRHRKRSLGGVKRQSGQKKKSRDMDL